MGELLTVMYRNHYGNEWTRTAKDIGLEWRPCTEEDKKGLSRRVVVINWADGSLTEASAGQAFAMNENGKTVASYDLANYPLVSTAELEK